MSSHILFYQTFGKEANRQSNAFHDMRVVDAIPNDSEQTRIHQAYNPMLDNEIEVNRFIFEERDQAIRQIESDIQVVHDIFVDMAGLVSDQSHLIDNIESSIDASVTNTSKGVVELGQAEKHQKSARTKLCVIATILLVVIFVVVVLMSLWGSIYLEHILKK